MKYFTLIALLLVGMTSWGQFIIKPPTRLDSVKFSNSHDTVKNEQVDINPPYKGGAGFGMGFHDSCWKEVAIRWQKGGWWIFDTMGLITTLEKEMDNQRNLHYLARKAILLYCTPDNQRQWKMFVAALKEYLHRYNNSLRCLDIRRKNKRH